jgi:hypothetical protein
VKSKDGLQWSCRECCNKRRKHLAEIHDDRVVWESEGKKQCRVCLEPKLLNEFYKEVKGVFGVKSTCKVCIQKAKREKKKALFGDSDESEDEVVQTVEDLGVIVEGPKDNAPCTRRAAYYERVKEHVESKGCQMITTYEEYDANNLSATSRYNIMGVCGHPSVIRYDMFKAQGCGMNCTKCVRKSISRASASKPNFTSMEYDGICYLESQISSRFHFQKMVEGTHADFAIKPIEVSDDLWLPVQLKTTLCLQAITKTYHFHKKKDYINIPLVCLCMQDKRMWMMNGNDARCKTAINIGGKKSIYDVYEVVDIQDSFQKAYDLFPKKQLSEINSPISPAQQQEQQYRRLREQYLPFLSFVYSIVDGDVTDFVLGRWKIQEKVASRHVRNGKFKSYVVMLHRSNNKFYQKGQNDSYWVAIPDSSTVYIIPERVLIERGYIHDPSSPRSKYKTALSLYPQGVRSESNLSGWANDYMFDYTKLTKHHLESFMECGKMTNVS